MFNPDITLGSATFSLVRQRENSSLRRDPAAALETPQSLTISHETAKNGRVSSVIYFDHDEVIDCDSTCGIPGASANIRTQFKISYNPSDGIVDIDTILAKQLAEMELWLVAADNMTKFRNKEH